MGWSNTRAAIKMPNAQLVALCDIDQSVLDKRMGDLKGLGVDAAKVKTYKDYRKLLEEKEIDFVIIGTPDHWHPLITIAACQAGKDVYCEKPIANSIGEVLMMEQAQKKYNRAKHRPFKTEHFHFNFRWFWEYAGGLMCDWGVHIIDYALFGMNATMPKTVAALGGKFAYPDLSHETPDTQSTIYEFDNFILSWEHALAIDNGPYHRDHGIGFIGNNGTLVVDRNGWEVIEEAAVKTKVMEPMHLKEDNGVQLHMENFAGVVRNRKMNELNCPIETAALVAKVCQMGNIAYRSGKKLTWDKAKQQFTDNSVNKQYLMPKYENDWKLEV